MQWIVESEKPVFGKRTWKLSTALVLPEPTTRYSSKVLATSLPMAFF